MEILSEKERLSVFRKQRETECFPIVNRGKLWYDCLSFEQLAELKQWYHDWLDVTKTLVIPVKPKWLNDKLEKEEIIL